MNARDRDGNVTSEIKVVADDLVVVSDQELHEYESTGKTMEAPTGKYRVKVTKARSGGTVGEKTIGTAVAAVLPELHRAPAPAEPEAVKKLYVHIKNPEDQAALLKLKETCSKFTGENEIILVLGEAKKTALRLPFKVDCKSDELVGILVRELGEDAVVLK